MVLDRGHGSNPAVGDPYQIFLHKKHTPIYYKDYQNKEKDNGTIFFNNFIIMLLFYLICKNI